uniref:Uncharacterized protein n=1 Tax=Rhizophora mucronata TaxID=61149 RepID=A0A2P2QRC7_RHIMU
MEGIITIMITKIKSCKSSNQLFVIKRQQGCRSSSQLFVINR